MSGGFKKILLLAVFVGALVAGAYYYMSTRDLESTDDATVDAHVAMLSARIAGYITDVAFQDNQIIKKDDVLLRISPDDYQVKLDHDQAALESAQAKLAAAQEGTASLNATFTSNLDSARASLATAQANEQKAKSDLDRFQGLNAAAYARQERDAAVDAEKAAAASVNSAQAKLRSAETAPHSIAANAKFIESLSADVDRAKSDVAQSQQNLSYTNVMAPFDGRVTKRSIEPGAYIQAGQQLVTLISNERWVTANFKESQITRMKPGQKVDIHIDAYPDHVFHGTIESLQSGTGARFSLFPPENATGNFVKIVQRVPVKINFTDPPDAAYMIGPGMSVVATVHVGT